MLNYTVNHMFECVDVELPDCEYCLSVREEDKYHKGTCAHCGAKLPVRRVGFDALLLQAANSTWTMTVPEIRHV